MEFSKDGRMLYCIAELSGNILVYSIDHESSMRPEFSLIQEIQADEVNAGGSADIHIHPSGKYLYTSHRLDNDGIAAFSINEDGTLEKIGYSRTARHPRNFMITPDGGLMLVACRDDKVIQVFRISEDGTLTLTPSVLRFESDMPSSVTVSR
jgi:6-phosphogluconolactonase (cycloisomerase 2 family)